MSNEAGPLVIRNLYDAFRALDLNDVPVMKFDGNGLREIIVEQRAEGKMVPEEVVAFLDSLPPERGYDEPSPHPAASDHYNERGYVPDFAVGAGLKGNQRVPR